MGVAGVIGHVDRMGTTVILKGLQDLSWAVCVYDVGEHLSRLTSTVQLKYPCGAISGVTEDKSRCSLG